MTGNAEALTKIWADGLYSDGGGGGDDPSAMHWMGTWFATTAYALYDTVVHSGATYVCITATGPDTTFPTAKFLALPGAVGPSDSGWWPDGWVRVPPVLVQSMAATHAVYSDSTKNYVAFMWGSGAYTVDWGDGTAPQDFAGDTLATHQFLWGNVSSSTLAPGGYRQAVVTVTPQPGQLFTHLRLDQHNPASSVYSTGWLAITVCGSLVTSLFVYGNYTHPLLAQFRYVGPSRLLGTSSMFGLITSLQSVVGTQWTATCSDTRQMFQGCSQLAAIDAFDTHNSTCFDDMFYGCTSLTTIPLLDARASTSFARTFDLCPNLQVGALVGTKYDISYAGCALPAAALNNIFANLATVTGQTITITGNPGAATCTRIIATAKGWTVAG